MKSWNAKSHSRKEKRTYELLKFIAGSGIRSEGALTNGPTYPIETCKEIEFLSQ